MATLAGTLVKYELDNASPAEYTQVDEVRCGDNNQLFVLARLPGSNRLFTAGSNGTVYSIDADAKSLEATEIANEKTPILSMVTSEQGVFLGTETGGLVFLDPTGKTRYQRELGQEIYSIALRQQGDQTDVFVAAKQPILARYRFHRESGLVPVTPVVPGIRETRFFSAVAVSKDRLYALDDKNSMLIIKLERNNPVPVIRRFQCTRQASFQHQILDLRKKWAELKIEPPFLRKGKILCSPNRSIVYSVGADSFVRGWVIDDDATADSFPALAVQFDPESHIAFQPKNPDLVWGLSREGNLQLIDAAGEIHIADEKAHARGAGIAPMPKSEYVVTWGDNQIKFWKPENQSIAPVRQDHWLQTDFPILGVAIHPDETQLAAVDEKGFVQVWDLVSMKLLHKQALSAQQGTPNSGAIDYNVDGSLLAALGPHSSGPIFETSTFRALPDHLPIASDSGKSICWSPTNPKRIVVTHSLYQDILKIIDNKDVQRTTFRSRNNKFRNAFVKQTADQRRFVSLLEQGGLGFFDPQTMDLHYQIRLPDGDYFGLGLGNSFESHRSYNERGKSYCYPLRHVAGKRSPGGNRQMEPDG